MKWIKKGLIFKAANNYDWMQTHAQVPVTDKIDEGRLKVYFGTRDKYNRTVTTYIEVEADDPRKVLYVHNKPVLSLGKLGSFDDSGAMPSWIVNYGNRRYLYYTGWNVGTTARYRLSIGVAISEDNGLIFDRLCEGPILDRTYTEPYFVSNPCVLIDNNLWRMWYLSCVKWEMFKGIAEPYYHIKYAESEDGINWKREGIICIDFKNESEGGIARPCVIKEGSIYKMWYCYRGSIDYRTNKQQSYRIGYAESTDGINWVRKDDEAGIDRSDAGWDSEMMAYPYVYEHKGMKYMFYNGNGFGEAGFGYAVLEEK